MILSSALICSESLDSIVIIFYSSRIRHTISALMTGDQTCALPISADVTEFVQRRPVEIDLVEEGRLRRHLHIVGGRHIMGLVPADAEIDATRRDHRLGEIGRASCRERGCQYV